MKQSYFAFFHNPMANKPAGQWGEAPICLVQIEILFEWDRAGEISPVKPGSYPLTGHEFK